MRLFIHRDMFRLNWKNLSIIFLSIVFAFYIWVYFAELSIAEHVFVETINNNPAAPANIRMAVFLSHPQTIKLLSWHQRDIEDILFNKLQEHFKDSTILIRRCSDAEYVEDSTGHALGKLFGTGYYDKDTHLRGERIEVGEVHWISPIKAEVDVYTDFGPLAGSQNTVTISFNGRIWTITGSRLKWIA